MNTESPLEQVVALLEYQGCRLPRRDDYLCPACHTPGLTIQALPTGHVSIQCRDCSLDSILQALAIDAQNPLSVYLIQGQGLGLGEGRGYSEGAVSYMPSPCISEGSAQPELLELVESFRLGELEPRPVRLGVLPVGASADLVQVALDLELLMGLRAAVFEERPLPYSVRFCAERMGWGENFVRASRVLRRLEALGVVECVGSMAPRPGVGRGTKLYAPPAGIAADSSERPALRNVNRARKAS